MKLYLAGPMRGIPEYNFPAFRAAATLLRSRGHEIVSPAELDESIGGPEVALQDMPSTMSRDLFALLACDGIVLLPGWEGSAGALLERHAAEVVNLRVFAMAPDGGLWREGRWDWVRVVDSGIGSS